MPMNAKSREKPSIKRRVLLLAALAVLVVAGWSAFWSYAAGEVTERLDDGLARARSGGVAIACPDRVIDGWPFRMEMRCTGLDVASPVGDRLTTGAVRAVALAYDPRHVLLEADGPLSLRAAETGIALSAGWASARASLRTRAEGYAAALSIRDASAALTGPFRVAGLAGPQNMAAALLEVHVRQNPERAEDADLAVTAEGLALSGIFRSELPVDAAVLLRLRDAGRPDLASAQRFAADLIRPGRSFEVVEARLAQGETRLVAQGTLAIEPTGALAGELDVTVSDPDRLDVLLAPLYPHGSPMPGAFKGVLASFGTATEVDGRPALRARLKISGGQVRIGLVPVAQIPPLF